MSRTASRYQRGLSYEPGMSESRYRPERAAVDLGQVGSYTGVTPIPGVGPDGGGVVAPLENGGGNGLGAGGNMLAGLALTALSNPRVTNFLTDQVRGTSNTTPTTNWIAMGGDGSPSAFSWDPSTWVEPPYYPPAPPSGPPTPGGEASGSSWVDPSAVSPDGGASVGDGFGAMDGGLSDGGAGGGWFSGLQGMAYEPGLTGLDGIVGSGLMGGGFDIFSGAATLGAGALGNWVAGNAGYENGRDPLGRQIGSGLGSAVGGLFLGPVGAFLGAQLGGAIGGQFGPQATVGGNWGTLNAYTPGAGWSSHTGADNGGQANPEFSQAFQNALLAYAQSQGMEINPLNNAMYTVGQFTGNGPNAPGAGYYYQPGAGPLEGVQQFFTGDLSAPSQFTGTTGTYGDAMLSTAFKDLASQGFWMPIGTALTGDALQAELGNRAAAAEAGRAAQWAGLEANAGPGN